MNVLNVDGFSETVSFKKECSSDSKFKNGFDAESCLLIDATVKIFFPVDGGDPSFTIQHLRIDIQPVFRGRLIGEPANAVSFNSANGKDRATLSSKISRTMTAWICDTALDAYFEQVEAAQKNAQTFLITTYAAMEVAAF
jgi:hypothetical protein